MKSLIVSFLLLFCIDGFSQTDCPYYKSYMDKGNAIMAQVDKADFQAAINAYSTAMLHCPVKAQEARDKILIAFKAIENLKNKALQSELAARVALAEQMKAEQLKQKADEARSLALKQLELQLKKTDSALEKANTLISAFYFYDNKFAVTYGPSRMVMMGSGVAIREKPNGDIVSMDQSDFIGERSVYYYIDRDGQPISEFDDWAWAEGFAFDGFARVSKDVYNNYTGEFAPVNYLIDTMGNKYLSAYAAENVKPNTEAFKLISRYDKFQLGVLPDTSLKVLILNYPDYGREEKLMEQVVSLKKLINLQMMGCQINTIPPEIGSFSNLTSLILGGNEIEDFPGSFWNIKNLAILNLRQNKLTLLPGEIGKLEKLKYLDVSENALTSLPEEIYSLKNLEMLDISDNKLNGLPDGIGNLKKLTKLKFRYNPLRKLPPGIGQLENLNYLNLYDCELTELPEEFGQLKNLKELYLDYNYLTNLPKSIGNLINLPKLSLYKNKLNQLPESIGNLLALKELSLSGNQLSELPESIGKLQNLEVLSLTHNQFKHLPPALFNLKKLKYLELDGNKIPKKEIENFKKAMPGCNVYYQNF